MTSGSIYHFLSPNPSLFWEQPEDANNDYSDAYQENLNTEGKGICARALYDYQAGMFDMFCFHKFLILGTGIFFPLCLKKA